MRFPKGIIAVHGYRETYSREEQIRIAKALQPVIELVEEELKKELAKPIDERELYDPGTTL